MKMIIGDLYEYRLIDAFTNKITYHMIGVYSGSASSDLESKNYNFNVVYDYNKLWNEETFSQDPNMLKNLSYFGPGPISNYPEYFLWNLY